MRQSMNHIILMLLSYYLHHTPNPDVRFIDALRYLGDKSMCSPWYMKLDLVDKHVHDILWAKEKPKCGEDR